MDRFVFSSVAQEIVCASDAIDATDGLGAMLERWHAERALIVCGPNIRSGSDVVGRVEAALGARQVGVFDGVLPHAPVHTLEAAMKIAKTVRPSVLVSVGGGSTHDTSKGIAILLADGGRIHDHETRAGHSPSNRPRLPILAVSTTMGGAELSRGAGFTDKTLGRKIGVYDSGTTPRGILIDGRALATTPTRILVGTAVGQLRIAVEMVCSRARNPFSDALAMRAIALLVERLPRCATKAPAELMDIKTAALMASMANQGSLGLCTALSHQIGGLYDVGHGEANAILLPHVMRFNASASGDQQAAIATAMSLRSGEPPADGIARLVEQLGLPTRLRDVGVPEEGLQVIAQAAHGERSLLSNPRRIDGVPDIVGVLREAW